MSVTFILIGIGVCIDKARKGEPAYYWLAFILFLLLIVFGIGELFIWLTLM